MNAYPVQTTARLSVTFTTAGVAVDPTTVTLSLTPPDDAPVQVITTEIVRDSEGHYHYDLVVDAAGLWIYRWQGTGAAVASSGNGFFQGT